MQSIQRWRADWEKAKSLFRGALDTRAHPHSRVRMDEKLNSKLVKYLNVKQEGQELLQENTGVENGFLNGTPFALKLRPEIDKWDFRKPKCFCETRQINNL